MGIGGIIGLMWSIVGVLYAVVGLFTGAYWNEQTTKAPKDCGSAMPPTCIEHTYERSTVQNTVHESAAQDSARDSTIKKITHDSIEDMVNTIVRDTTGNSSIAQHTARGSTESSQKDRKY